VTADDSSSSASGADTSHDHLARHDGVEPDESWLGARAVAVHQVGRAPAGPAPKTHPSLL